MTADTETPLESQPVNIEMPTAESLTTETETPTESQPVNIEMPTESLPTDTETPTDSQPVQMEMPTESLTSDTETPTESQPVNIEMPTESLPSDTESPTEGQPANIELSVENVPDEILSKTQPVYSKIFENLSGINSSISHSRLPFPDVSKKFYFREGGRWARHETHNKDDVSPMKTSKDGLNVLRRGNLSGSLSENIAHLRKELKSEKDGHKRAFKYGVIKVVVKLKASIVLSTREAALLYTSEKSRILNIQDTQSSYRASDTYKILFNYLNVAQLYIFGVAYLFAAHGRDLNQISQAIFSLMSRFQDRMSNEKALLALAFLSYCPATAYK